MSRPAPRAARSHPAGVLAAIEAFLATARQPVLQEPGELPFPLAAGRYTIDSRATGVEINVWDETRQLHRRAIGAEAGRPGRLTLTIERFGHRTGQMLLYDDARPAAATLRKQGERHHFREFVRGLIRKQFPGQKLLDLSADLDLEHSLSANYPRALLAGAKSATALIAAAPGPADPNHALTYGLVWLDYLRRREPALRIETLALVLPPEALTPAALRLRHLTGARFRLFTYTPEGLADEVDPADCGNLHTELLSAEERRPSPLQPESQFGERLRGEIEALDGTLRPAPLYGQVIAVAGVQRSIPDIVAVDYESRLAVIELKVSEDIHLPLQALDYWARVAHHAAAGEFGARGYFPGTMLRPDPPRLLLAAPAFSFHPTTETILRFFSSNIPVERIGLALEWRQKVRVLFRLHGASSPE